MTQLAEVADLESFRAEVRDWIAANRIPGLEEVKPEPDAVLHPNSPYKQTPLIKEWMERLRDGGWLCVGWPKEYGGRGLSAPEVVILNQEFTKAGVPRLTRGLAEGIAGPAVILFGTEEQKQRFLPRIISGEDVYCEGYSEPNAGSDLASLTTRGVVDGDDLVITGQKVWTSDSASSNMVFVLCRTDPNLPRHAGLSFVLTPLHDNNIEIRPLKQMNGKADFAEVFYDGARAPLANVIGGLTNGWKVVMTVRGSGIAAAGGGGGGGYGYSFWELVRTLRERGYAGRDSVRQQLTQMYIESEVLRYSGLRTLARISRGRPPGPAASIAKVANSEFNSRLMELAMELLGPAAMLTEDETVERWQQLFYQSRALTIGGGTSEIHRNIAATRVLGLPREP